MNRRSMSKQSKTRQNQLEFCRRTSNAEKLSILLVGPHEFCYSMQECLHYLFKKIHKTDVTVSVSESIENILKTTLGLHIDFIVFLMNTAKKQAIEQVERDICLLDPLYLCDKTVIVNGCNNLSPAYLGTNYNELFSLAQKYHLHIFHGDMQVENNCTNLGNRIVTFITAVCGLKTGTPIVLHFPTDKFPLY